MRNFVFFHLFFFIGIQIASPSNDHEASTSRGPLRRAWQYAMDETHNEIEEMEEEEGQNSTLRPHHTRNASTSPSRLTSPLLEHQPPEEVEVQWRLEVGRRLRRIEESLHSLLRYLEDDVNIHPRNRLQKLKLAVAIFKKMMAVIGVCAGYRLMKGEDSAEY